MPTLTLDEIEIAALRLPEWDRLHVAEILLASLDNDENVRDAWVAEAERRATGSGDVDRGDARGRHASIDSGVYVSAR